MRLLPWSLAWARLRQYPLRNLSLVLIVAFGLLVLLGLDGVELSSQSSIVNYSLSQLQAGERNDTINSSQILTSKDQYQTVDRYLRSHIGTFAKGGVTQEVIYSQLSDLHGLRFNLGAITSLRSNVKLISGRWPNPCSAGRCEVISIGGQRNNSVRPAPFGLTIVGVGSILNNDAFAGTMSPPAGTSLLLTDDISGISALPKFANSHGADAWVTNLDLAKISSEGVTRYIAHVIAFEDQMSIDLPNMILTWPQDAVSAAGDQSRQFGQKIKLIDFSVLSILLAFLAIVAHRGRRDQIKFRASLSRIGTPKRTLIWEVLLESASPIIAGTLLAIALSPFLILSLNLFNYHFLPSQGYLHWSSYLFLAFAAIFFVVGISTFRDYLSKIFFTFCSFLSLIFLILLLWTSGIRDIKYLLTPFLYAIIPTALCYVLMHYLVHLFRKYKRDSYIIFREYISIWRGVALMLSLATILAALSLAYDSGISNSVNQRSRDLVPLDLSIKVGQSLTRPLDIASNLQFSALAPGSVAYPILRTGTSIRSQGSVSDSLELIGVPAQAIVKVDKTLKGFTSEIRKINFTSIHSIPILNSKTMSVHLVGIPPQIDLTAWFLTPNGTKTSAIFQGTHNIRTLSFAGLVPSGSFLIAFELQESSNDLSRRLHAIGEGNYSIPAISGIGSIRSLSLDGKLQNLSAAIWGTKNFHYSIDGTSLYVRPQLDQSIPQVITDPTTAQLAQGGRLTLSDGGSSFFQVQVKSVRKYFPSAGNRFVAMDLSQLQNQISKTNIGATDPIELWISSKEPNKYLAQMKKSPFVALVTQSRLQIANKFASDPNSAGLIAAYRVSLLFALILALFMVCTALPMLRRDAFRTLFYLESTGMTPQSVRKSLRTAVSTSVLVGLISGSLIGILVAKIYLSQSIPYLSITLLSASIGILSWIGTMALSAKFFTEKSMVI